jgi:hypothetical protein
MPVFFTGGVVLVVVVVAVAARAAAAGGVETPGRADGGVAPGRAVVGGTEAGG